MSRRLCQLLIEFDRKAGRVAAVNPIEADAESGPDLERHVEGYSAGSLLEGIIDVFPNYGLDSTGR